MKAGAATFVVIAALVSPAQVQQIDPGTPLESRLQSPPKEVLDRFKEIGVVPTPHTLTDAERRAIAAAFAGLPPLHRRVLGEHLRAVSIVDGIPNTALTSTVNPGQPFLLFDITIRAGALSRNVSAWLTEKERTCFETNQSTLNVSIEAGATDAIAYVLLHEATHVVDLTLGLTATGTFTSRVWTDRTTPAPPYREPLLQRIAFRGGGAVLPIAQAEPVYRALARTPFVSLYASSNWGDDLAEFVSWYHLSQKLRQPYRVVVRDGQRVVFAYEPMASALVRARFGEMASFYSLR